MFIEHKMLYGVKGNIPMKTTLSPTASLMKREGNGRDGDHLLADGSPLAGGAAELLAKEGVSVEVIDLRTLKPLDMDTIAASVKKTGPSRRSDGGLSDELLRK